jgi:hypothetical protein
MDDYSGLREAFTGMHGPQNSMQDVTDIVDIFKLFFDKDLVQKIVDETSHYAQQLKSSKRQYFFKGV